MLAWATHERLETHPEVSLEIALQELEYFAGGSGLDISSGDIRARMIFGPHTLQVKLQRNCSGGYIVIKDVAQQ